MYIQLHGANKAANFFSGGPHFVVTGLVSPCIFRVPSCVCWFIGIPCWTTMTPNILVEYPIIISQQGF